MLHIEGVQVAGGGLELEGDEVRQLRKGCRRPEAAVVRHDGRPVEAGVAEQGEPC